jgi:hypothetical protein
MLGEDGRGLTKEESTKSPLGIEISMEDNSNRHGGGLGIKSSSWERERERNRVKNYSGERRSWATGGFIDR